MSQARPSRKKHPFPARIPEIVIDGVGFYRWYDCLSDLAVGASQPARRRARS